MGGRVNRKDFEDAARQIFSAKPGSPPPADYTPTKEELAKKWRLVRRQTKIKRRYEMDEI